MLDTTDPAARIAGSSPLSRAVSIDLSNHIAMKPVTESTTLLSVARLKPCGVTCANPKAKLPVIHFCDSRSWAKAMTSCEVREWVYPATLSDSGVNLAARSLIVRADLTGLSSSGFTSGPIGGMMGHHTPKNSGA